MTGTLLNLVLAAFLLAANGFYVASEFALVKSRGFRVDTGEVEHCRQIASGGTSAEAQVKIFTENEHEGADIALNKVARWIRDTTLVA